MLYVFLVLALLASCALTWAASGFATLHALWQVPVFFAGSFLALVLLFLLALMLSDALSLGGIYFILGTQ